LKSLNCDLRTLRLEVEKFVKSGQDTVTMGRIPQTPKTKLAIECAIAEARGLGHNYVGTEHLLLGLLSESPTTPMDGNVAQQVLKSLGLTLERVREEVKVILGIDGQPPKIEMKEDIREVLEKIRKFLDEYPEKAKSLSEDLDRILENDSGRPDQETEGV
jgi:ATP-dependent Clp protease ATP-binding subunit ClpA